MVELDAVWASLSQVMQDQVRTVIVNIGWQQVWRMVGAMPADAQPVVTSAFADTPVDIRGRVRQIVATRTIADTLHDQRLAASVSRIEGVDQAGLAKLASEGGIVEQNVVYHLPKGGALVVSVNAQGYRGAVAMRIDEALALPSLVYRKIEQNHDLARRDGDEAVACQSKPTMIAAEEAALLNEVGAGLAMGQPSHSLATHRNPCTQNIRTH